MVDKEPYELSICVDCLMILANGECNYESEADRVKHEAGMVKHLADDEVTLGRLTPNDICQGSDHDNDCTCDQFGFRWGQCDGCGSVLGGDRYAATLWLDHA